MDTQWVNIFTIFIENSDKNKEIVAEIKDRISDLKDRIREMGEKEKKQKCWWDIRGY